MNCPACIEKRVHTPGDWVYHPYAGHGYQERQGWTHRDLDPATHRAPDAGAVTSRISGEISVEATAPAAEEV